MQEKVGAPADEKDHEGVVKDRPDEVKLPESEDVEEGEVTSDEEGEIKGMGKGGEEVHVGCRFYFYFYFYFF